MGLSDVSKFWLPVCILVLNHQWWAILQTLINTSKSFFLFLVTEKREDRRSDRKVCAGRTAVMHPSIQETDTMHTFHFLCCLFLRKTPGSVSLRLYSPFLKPFLCGIYVCAYLAAHLPRTTLMYISLPLQKTDESSTIQHGVKVSASARVCVCDSALAPLCFHWFRRELNSVYVNEVAFKHMPWTIILKQVFSCTKTQPMLGARWVLSCKY